MEQDTTQMKKKSRIKISQTQQKHNRSASIITIHHIYMVTTLVYLMYIPIFLTLLKIYECKRILTTHLFTFFKSAKNLP